MQRLDLWFGGSYPAGTSLAETESKPKTVQTRTLFKAFSNQTQKRNRFPTLVSAQRNRNVLNFSKPASSIGFALSKLLKYIKSEHNIHNDVTAFLCTLPIGRTHYYDSVTEKDVDFMLYHLPTEQQQWVARSALYNDTILYNAFYTTCVAHNIKLYILPIYSPLELHAPENIIPENTCLFSPTDPLTITDRNLLCRDREHPNIEGHAYIADKILNALDR